VNCEVRKATLLLMKRHFESYGNRQRTSIDRSFVRNTSRLVICPKGDPKPASNPREGFSKRQRYGRDLFHFGQFALFVAGQDSFEFGLSLAFGEFDCVFLDLDRFLFLAFQV